MNTEKPELFNWIVTPSNRYRNTIPWPNGTNTNTGGKKECSDYEENYVWKEDHITKSQERRLKNSKVKTKIKNKQILIHFSKNNIIELN